MQIHGVKLNWKNFWIPIIFFTVLSILIYVWVEVFGQYLVFGEEDLATPFYVYFLEQLITVLLVFFPLGIIIAATPIFFMIRRLLSEKPNKIFYLELPLIALLPLLLEWNSLMGWALMDTSRFLAFTILPIFILVVTYSAIATSIYFYYKKFIIPNIERTTPKPFFNKMKLNIRTFWGPLILGTIFSILAYEFSSSISFYIAIEPLWESYGQGMSFLQFLGQSNFLSFSIVRIMELIIMTIAMFLIIRRLIGDKPKRIFYIEMPILILTAFMINVTISALMMLSGTPWNFLIFSIPQAIWIFILTISMYFYYKKFVK